MASNASSSFYLTLPSNSSLREYPENTLTSYKVKLPHNIVLEGEWEAGLVEIHYPHRWYNCLASEDKGGIQYTGDGGHTWKTLDLTDGYFGDIKSVLKLIVPQEMRDKVLFSFNEITQKVYVEVTERPIGVRMFGTLANMLGFNEWQVILVAAKGKRPVDMDMIHNLYVYCDIIEHQIFGDVRAPFLRVIPVKEKHGNDDEHHIRATPLPPHEAQAPRRH